MKKLLLLSLFLGVFVWGAEAQRKPKKEKEDKNIDRIEFEIKDDSYKYATHCGSNGFLMHGPSKDLGKKTWEFHRFNADLKETEKFHIPIGKKMRYETYYMAEDKSKVYILLRNKGKGMVIEYNIKSGVANEFPFKFEKNPAIINSFFVVNRQVYFGGTKHALYLNLEEESTVAVNILNKSKGVSMKSLNMIGEDLGVAVCYYKGNDNSMIYADIYGQNGGMEETIKVKMDKGNKASSINISRLPNGHYILSGSYYAKSSTENLGLYVIKYSNGVDYTNFITFNEILGTEKKKVLGVKTKKDKVQTRNTLNHAIKIVGNKAVLISEIYYAEYRTETRVVVDAQGRSRTETRQVFEGWRFTSGIGLFFELDGGFSGSSIFGINYLDRTRLLRKQMQWYQSDKTTKLLKVDGNQVYLKNISPEFDNISIGNSFSFTDEKSKYTDAHAEYWYDNFLISYGSQLVKGEKKRRVFFMARIRIPE
jgi:hypothetical protein